MESKNLKELIAKKEWNVVRDLVRTIPLNQFSDAFEELDIKDQLLLLRVLKTRTSALVFSSLDIDYQKELVSALNKDEMVEIYEQLYSDEAADLLEEVPSNIAKMILANTSKEKRDIANKLLSYEKDEVGSVMNVDITVLKSNWTSKRALVEIRKYRRSHEFSSYYFVKSNRGMLRGMVSIEDLVFASPSTLINTLLIQVEALTTRGDIEEAAYTFKEQDFPVLPVINGEKLLVGMVTSDDVIDIIEEEASEDIMKMSGIEPTEMGYFKTSILKIVRSRVFWLTFLMLSATVSQIVLDTFMGITDRAFPPKGGAPTGQVFSSSISTMLVTIIPVISGAAGNAGSQSSTTITRGLAVKEINNRDYGKVFWRETQVGFVVGLIMGLANFLRLVIYYGVKDHSINETQWWISVGASIALLVVIMFSKIVGGILPLVAILFKQDPAVMAAPLITTLTDALSSMIFFSINIGILLLAIQ